MPVAPINDRHPEVAAAGGPRRMAASAFASILRGSLRSHLRMTVVDWCGITQKKAASRGQPACGRRSRRGSRARAIRLQAGGVRPRRCAAGDRQSAAHGQKLRWARKIAATTFWSLTWKFWVGSATAVLTIALPPKALCRLLYMISTPRSKFLTGFQIVREPTCQKAKSGEQLVGVKPAPLPRLAKPAPVQIRLVAAPS